LDNSVDKEKLYHQIALACLKVLKNPTAAGEGADQIQAVYDAIDQAFNSQFTLLNDELEDCKQRLQLIADLNPDEYQLVDAQDIAQHSGAKH